MYIVVTKIVDTFRNCFVFQIFVLIKNVTFHKLKTHMYHFSENLILNSLQKSKFECLQYKEKSLI